LGQRAYNHRRVLHQVPQIIGKGEGCKRRSSEKRGRRTGRREDCIWPLGNGTAIHNFQEVSQAFLERNARGGKARAGGACRPLPPQKRVFVTTSPGPRKKEEKKRGEIRRKNIRLPGSSLGGERRLHRQYVRLKGKRRRF